MFIKRKYRSYVLFSIPTLFSITSRYCTITVIPKDIQLKCDKRTYSELLLLSMEGKLTSACNCSPSPFPRVFWLRSMDTSFSRLSICAFICFFSFITLSRCIFKLLTVEFRFSFSFSSCCSFAESTFVFVSSVLISMVRSSTVPG